MNNAATTKADGCMVAVDLMQGCRPEFGTLDGEALMECRRVLAMQGYRLEVAPKLRAVLVDHLPTEANIAFARHAISHTCDGPITPFVLISRACELRGVSHETAANALYEELRSRGWVSEEPEAAGEVAS